MKLRKVTCWLLRIPFTFPLIEGEQHAFANSIEIESDEGHKGHALLGNTRARSRMRIA